MCIVLNLDLMLLTAFGGKLVIDFVVDFWCSMLALGNLRIRHRILKKSPPPPGRPSSSPPGGPGGPALAVPGGSSGGSRDFGRDQIIINICVSAGSTFNYQDIKIKDGPQTGNHRTVNLSQSGCDTR